MVNCDWFGGSIVSYMVRALSCDYDTTEVKVGMVNIEETWLENFEFCHWHYKKEIAILSLVC